jgi:methylated-DNA-[protein]-cysteine S-methyltransferase
MTDIESNLRRSGRIAIVPRDVTDRLVRRAADDGLLDIAYAPVDSPFGPLLAAATPRGLISLSFPETSEQEVLTDLSRMVSPRIMLAPARLDRVRGELDEYFAGTRRHFELTVDWRLVRGFGRAVLRYTSRIPYGQVRTYREVAGHAGSPAASRAAGNALGANPIPIVVPCHRVVRSGGGLGGYGGGIDRKEWLLRHEGAPV